MKTRLPTIFATFFSLFWLVAGYGDTPNATQEIDLRNQTLINEAAFIPPQCYTKTKAVDGNAYNPCFTCHTVGRPPNYIDDSDLQTAYAFPEYALNNHWNNLFEKLDESANQISDDEITRYIQRSNYSDSAGNVVLAKKLRKVPPQWDVNGNKRWDGFLPDAYFNFDTEGFDRSPDGEITGWRAFAYMPFPGSFWPTNGSTDDVLIRLPRAYYTNEQGDIDLSVYKTNLAILEAMILQNDIAIETTNEEALKVDLNKDGKLNYAHNIRYDWAPQQGRYMSFVGRAGLAKDAAPINIAAGLFPVGTEFLHSVRYIDMKDGKAQLSKRMKELRYARKNTWFSYGQLQQLIFSEIKEKEDFPDRLRLIRGNPETGLHNGSGWVYQGFIEDRTGELRPQTYEETVYCMGCHGGIGATTDSNFSFPRKLQATDTNQAWHHWSQRSIKGNREFTLSKGEGEFSHYLEANGAGDEFRSNSEVIDRFFDKEGKPIETSFEQLRSDVSALLYPSKARALALNKLYKALVEQQSFIYGRDSLLSNPDHIYRSIPADEPTGINKPLINTRAIK